MTKALVLLVSLFLSACASGGLGDVERTFYGAYVAYPGEKTAKVKNIEAITKGPSADGKRYPVILYLHGCTGIGREERAFGAKLAAEGYVFVAPNSMARTYRPLQCNPKKQTGGFNRFVFDFRMAEISYALEYLSLLDWVDTQNMLLMGGSEGGVGAALYRGDEFSGRIIFQWTCHGGPLVNGIAAPEGEPVLAIVNAGDPWYDEKNTKDQSGDCGAFFGNRRQSASIVMHLGDVHNVLDEKRTEILVKDFLVKIRN